MASWGLSGLAGSGQTIRGLDAVISSPALIWPLPRAPQPCMCFVAKLIVEDLRGKVVAVTISFISFFLLCNEIYKTQFTILTVFDVQFSVIKYTPIVVQPSPLPIHKPLPITHPQNGNCPIKYELPTPSPHPQPLITSLLVSVSMGLITLGASYTVGSYSISPLVSDFFHLA